MREKEEIVFTKLGSAEKGKKVRYRQWKEIITGITPAGLSSSLMKWQLDERLARRIAVISKIAQRLGKRKAMIVVMSVWALVNGVFLLMVDQGDAVLLYSLLFFAAMGNSCIYLVGL
ncbi:hypothetical protein ACFLTD_01485 [Elusimicrobiota bacterium]